MKMEHINENTIRVLLGSDDLSARGITVLDLLGNHKQIQEFFYSILDEVDTDHEFRDNDAVTFQVLPTRTGLELFISKADPDSNDSNANNAAISKYIKREMTAKDQPQLASQPDNQQQEMDQPLDSQEDDLNDQSVVNRVIKFKNFENLVSASHQVESLDQMASDLYKLDDGYYLVLSFFNDGTLSPESIGDLMAIFSEFDQQTSLTADVLAEHGKLLMEHSALEQIKYYFK